MGPAIGPARRRDLPVRMAIAGWARLLALELDPVELGVLAAGGQQLVVAAALDDAPVVEDQDHVGLADRRQPVGDDQRGAPLQGGGQGLLHGRLGLRVEVGGGFVQHHHLGGLEQDPGDGDPLLLAPRQAVAPVAHHGVEAVGQRGDHGGDLGPGQGGLELPVGGIGFGVEQVAPDGVVEQVGVLGDHADGGGQRGRGGVPHVEPVDADGSRPDVVEAGQRVG